MLRRLDRRRVCVEVVEDSWRVVGSVRRTSVGWVVETEVAAVEEGRRKKVCMIAAAANLTVCWTWEVAAEGRLMQTASGTDDPAEASFAADLESYSEVSVAVVVGR